MVKVSRPMQKDLHLGLLSSGLRVKRREKGKRLIDTCGATGSSIVPSHLTNKTEAAIGKK